jgi:hypothetical protein
VFAPKGAAMLGLAWSDIDAKLRALLPAAGVAEPTIAAIMDAVRGIAQAPNVVALIRLLRRDV